MDQFVLDNLSTYGPIAVFALLMLSGIGLALGEEMVTLPAGMMIAAHPDRLDFATTAITAYVAIVLADFMWFGLCRRYGTRMLHMRFFKRLIHPRRMLEVKHQFERRGVWLIVMARFIPSSRSTAITVAGIMHMPFWKFAAATAGCVLITVPTQLTLGYLVGKGLGTEDMANLFLKMLGLIALVVAITVIISWWNRHRAGMHRPQRARASWLRRFRKKPPNGNGNGSGAPAKSAKDADSVSSAVPLEGSSIAVNESTEPEVIACPGNKKSEALGRS